MKLYKSGKENQPISSVKWVDPKELKANEYNPNHVAPIEMELLKTSLLENGWTDPIKITEENEIVDGFHRWTLGSKDKDVQKLGDGLVPTVIASQKDRATQYMATIRMNRARGSHGIEHMARIVRALIDDEGLDYEEIMERCGMEWEEVDRLYDKSGMTKKGAYENKEFSAGWIPKDKREKGKY